jgi:hypothetical protein
MNLGDVGWEIVDWLRLAHDRDHWRVFVMIRRNFLNSWVGTEIPDFIGTFTRYILHAYQLGFDSVTSSMWSGSRQSWWPFSVVCLKAEIRQMSQLWLCWLEWNLVHTACSFLVSLCTSPMMSTKRRSAGRPSLVSIRCRYERRVIEDKELCFLSPKHIPNILRSLRHLCTWIRFSFSYVWIWGVWILPAPN